MTHKTISRELDLYKIEVPYGEEKENEEEKIFEEKTC